jgi:hypothetical protein
MRER